VDALAEAASDALTHLLELARPGGAEPRPLDLACRLRALVQTLDRVTPPTVRLECDTPEAFHAFALPALISQATANLVLNAADALPESGGTVRVRLCGHTGPDGQAAVVIEVADDGPGIAPAAARRLFERGFTTKRAGCGLGLSLVDAIAAAHGGRVEVESLPACGSTFRIVIPHIPVALDEVDAASA
jgi:two-component system OmpR family sensor kinase